MAPRTFLLKVFLVWTVLVVTGYLFFGYAAMAPMKAGLSTPPWVLASNAVAAVALAFLAVRSQMSVPGKALTLSAVYYGVQAVNSIEGVVYLSLPFTVIILPLMTGAATVPLWMLIFPASNGGTPSPYTERARSLGGWLWRFLLCDFGYIFLYMAAGMIIFPFVRSFYATKHLPSMQQVISLQLLLRGPLFVGLCLLISRMVCRPGIAGALAVGGVFTLLSGVVPLMVPNPYLPDAVRWVHSCEVVSSNFVFGTIAAAIFRMNGLPSGETVEIAGQAKD